MVLSSFLETTIYSRWKIEQKYRSFFRTLKCTCYFFQNYLELFKCSISPLTFGGVSIFRERCTFLHPPSGVKYVAATWCEGKVINTGNLYCIVIAWLSRMELIKRYFMSTR